MRWGWQETLAVAGALLLPLLQQDAFEWCYWLAERLLRRAVRRLPPAHRRRYSEEWLAELAELRDRNLSALLWALWVFACAPSVGRGLREEPADRWRLLCNGYVTGVSAAGLGLGGWLLAHGGLAVTGQGRRSFLVLVGLAAVAQLRPYLTRVNTGSLSFGSLDLALVIGWGMAAGAPAAALATMLGHLGGRRSADRVLFNGGQYVLCLAGAGWVFEAARESLPGSLRTLAIVAAAVAFTALNSLLMRVLFALQHPDAIAQQLRTDWTVEGLMCVALIATAPFVPLVLQSRAVFIPLLLLPEAALLLLVFRLCPALGSPPARAARR